MRCQACGQAMDEAANGGERSWEERYEERFASLPAPVSLTFRSYWTETQPVLKVHKMLVLAEVATRLLAIAALSDLYRADGGFGELKSMLYEKLPRPGFGHWKEMLERSLKAVRTDRSAVPELHAYYGGIWSGLLGSKLDIIRLRNGIYHGTGLDETLADTYLQTYAPAVEQAVAGLAGLWGYELVCRDSDDRVLRLHGIPDERTGQFPVLETGAPFKAQMETGTVYMMRDGRLVLSMGPLYLFDRLPDADSYELQLYQKTHDRANWLEYAVFSRDIPFVRRGAELRKQFESMFPLRRWREELRRETDVMHHMSRTLEMADQLTRSFVGRRVELQHVQDEIGRRARRGGTFWLEGPPGIGKSACMAELFKTLRDDRELLVFAYFFKAGDVSCRADSFWTAACAVLQAAGLGAQGGADQHGTSVRERLASMLAEDGAKPIVLLLDGLNELPHADVLALQRMMAERYPGVVWVASAQPQSVAGHSADRYTLGPLGEADIRRLLLEETGALAYSLLKRDDRAAGFNPFVARVAEYSAGNPLFIELLLQELLSGSITFLQEDRLPQSLDAYLTRLLAAGGGGNRAYIAGLCAGVLAHAHAAIGIGELRSAVEHHLAKPLAQELWDAVVHDMRAWTAAAPTAAGDQAGVRLFHDAFRQYMRSPEADLLGEQGAAALFAWCVNWQAGGGTYAASFYWQHLTDRDMNEALLQLLADGTYIEAQRQLAQSDEQAVRMLCGVLRHAAACGDSRLAVRSAAKLLELYTRTDDKLRRRIQFIPAEHPELYSNLYERLIGLERVEEALQVYRTYERELRATMEAYWAGEEPAGDGESGYLPESEEEEESWWVDAGEHEGFERAIRLALHLVRYGFAEEAVRVIADCRAPRRYEQQAWRLLLKRTGDHGGSERLHEALTAAGIELAPEHEAEQWMLEIDPEAADAEMQEEPGMEPAIALPSESELSAAIECANEGDFRHALQLLGGPAFRLLSDTRTSERFRRLASPKSVYLQLLGGFIVQLARQGDYAAIRQLLQQSLHRSELLGANAAPLIREATRRPELAEQLILLLELYADSGSFWHSGDFYRLLRQHLFLFPERALLLLLQGSSHSGSMLRGSLELYAFHLIALDEQRETLADLDSECRGVIDMPEMRRSLRGEQDGQNLRS